MTARPAGEIGAGLASARAPRPIAAGERIHVLGVAGAGASAAALLAAWAGAAVDGCDPGGPGPYTAALEAAGIPLAWSHDAAHLAGMPPGRVAVTKALTAVDPDHPELAAARTAGVPLEPWQQVVADAAAGRLLVGVAGTHGKSTTAGWLVHLLAAAGSDPGAFVGALLPAVLTGAGVAATARRGRGRPFVVEADEYAGNFDPYRPAVAVLTSAEWDHPDVFDDLGAVLAAFEAWVRRLDGSALPDGRPVLVANAADPGVAALAGRLGDWPGRLVCTALVPADEGARAAVAALRGRFGTRAGAAGVLVGTIVDATAAGTSVDLIAASVPGLADGAVGRVLLPTAGRHNAANALGVAGAAAACGIAGEAIRAGLAGFGGVGRRLERKGEARGVVVYDDYGHHPTAIRVTLAALRQREPGRRIWAVYEPLTHHRTAALLEGFATVLAEADAVAIAEVWAGRDRDTSIASAEGLAAAVRAVAPALRVLAPGSVEATTAALVDAVRPGDAVLVMGGGRSYRIAELLLERLAASG